MREDFKQAFEAIDGDKDKLISFNDLKSFLESVGEKRTDE
jgi:Ca2+-binding EF-hand superfamily protein